ncbi:hypothetical protein [Actinopolymorpha sp. B9G3]|uniref:hypothetical protein n=1 Tax=Actinopolymorpha sp. B9G3 TaxID=3158970 RepID=UPI0032D95062
MTLGGTGVAAVPAVEDTPSTGALPPGAQVRGWNVLTDSVPDGLRSIGAAAGYDINHLQISHDVIHDLRHVRDARRLGIAETYTAAARYAGIAEVAFWDHSLYSLSYYPDEFKTGPGGTLDLDDPAFWEWFRADYREMLDVAPDIDALILTFVETGARVENQHSDVLVTAEQKLAYLVDQVADVVVEERGMNLYVRDFGYYPEEIQRILGAIELIDNPRVRVMTKETPHDFFLTHPVNTFTAGLDRDVLVEFDATGEFHGQGIIANTFPEVGMQRWRAFERQANVVGYVARTDRYDTSGIVDTPTEINLYGLKRAVEDPAATADDVYREFVTRRYGSKAAPIVAKAFHNARNIITSSMYTLGTNIANHSELDYDPYCSSYYRHVSGKWLDPPVADVRHTVNRTLHYWTGVVDHLGPVSCKSDSGVAREVPWVLENGWLDQEHDRMDATYLGYVMKEKDHGVRLAEESLGLVDSARSILAPDRYAELRGYFERTVLTAKIHRAVATAYFGYRLYARGVPPDDEEELARTIWTGLDEAHAVAEQIRAYPGPVSEGQWTWRVDADQADLYIDRIANGWDKYGGIAVPRPASTSSYGVGPEGGLR